MAHVGSSFYTVPPLPPRRSEPETTVVWRINARDHRPRQGVRPAAFAVIDSAVPLSLRPAHH